MRTVKTAAVVLLLILVPHQAPFAETVKGVDEAAAQADSGEQESKARPSPSTEDEAAAGTSAMEDASPASGPSALESRIEGQVETDGYSWSARSLR